MVMILYRLIISPLELLFEVIFSISNRIIGNEGLSIIFLSLAVNFLVLPLYKRADELQAEERDIQARMASRIRHIKKTFKGDERFFMLQEYYRINHYKPVYALKSSVSLLLQIPFFIAAYNLLSGMQCLHGMQFGFISDLGKEDAMFYIGSFPVNILPILMTLINIVSGIIYTKGHPLKAKIQVYGLAAVFLVLLYHSPSGLVFYWLLNNVFSLVKNVFYKLKDPKKALSIILVIAGAVMLVYTVTSNALDLRQKILVTTGCILLCIPFISVFFKNKEKAVQKGSKKDFTVFFAGAVMMATVTGLLIPSAVINSSPYEFIDITGSAGLMDYILNSMLLSFGSWVLWGGIFYFFMNRKAKELFNKSIWIICGISLTDYMVFGTNNGVLSSALQYESPLSYSLINYLINAVSVIAVVLVFCFFYSKFRKIVNAILIVGVLSVIFVSVMNLPDIILASNWYKDNANPTTDMPSVPLSKEGKNVIVILLDRSTGTQVPYMFDEKPELLEEFDGFTYYPNTISYGSSTLFGAPALYGGYEYTPGKMNERDNESLESKHNEALKVLPVIFGENGYEVTVCDPSYAGYKEIPDLTIYDDYPDFNCYITNGRFGFLEEGPNSDSVADMAARMNEMRNRNFYCYSLMRVCPLILQETIYDGGAYNESVSANGDSIYEYNTSPAQYIYGNSVSTGYYHAFIDAYTVLEKLPDITEISESNDNTFLMMTNYTSHAPCLLQKPDYVPAMYVDNTDYDVNIDTRYVINGRTMQMEERDQFKHYQVNMAAFLKLGEWFDYLKENNVYDNTRIIIVADHGYGLGQFDVECNDVDMEFFMPLLMVKDFNAKGFTVCDDFMTNGDTPALATADIIEDPVNPFTGNPINSDAKSDDRILFYSENWQPEDYKGNTFTDGSWFTFSGGDPFDPDNWVYLGDH